MKKGERRRFIQIATQLGYSEVCIYRLNKAETELEAERILHDARNGLI